MMKLSSYHNHTTFCDGKNTPEEMILAAIERGCPEIGLSGHSPVGDHSYSMTPEGCFDYFNELSRLREKYKNDIRVFIGIEEEYTSEPPTLSYDYIIGSVHMVRGGNEEFDVDHSVERTRLVVDKYYGGDPYSYCEAYYERVADVYNKTHCDIIGHFDLVTKFIEKDPLFSIDHPRYIKARDEALKSLIASPAVFEVNTGAIARGYRTEAYPDAFVLETLKNAGKPIVINSDSHRADTVDFMIDDVYESLSKKGMKICTSMNEILSFRK